MKAEEGQGAIGRYSWTCVKLLKLPVDDILGFNKFYKQCIRSSKVEE